MDAGATWKTVHNLLPPGWSARTSFSLIVDTLFSRLILFGGKNPTTTSDVSTELWTAGLEDTRFECRENCVFEMRRRRRRLDAMRRRRLEVIANVSVVRSNGLAMLMRGDVRSDMPPHSSNEAFTHSESTALRLLHHHLLLLLSCPPVSSLTPLSFTHQ